MQKVSPSTNTKNWLPSIYPDPAKRSTRCISNNSHKENIHTENSCRERVHHTSNNRFAKKMSAHLIPAKYEELKEGLLQEKEVRCVETKRKYSRNWLDKQIDLNKQTIKNKHLTALLHQPPTLPLKNTYKKTLADHGADETVGNLSATRQLILNKTRGQRRASQRNDSVGHQKITPCKIAMKRGAFPLNKKHYQELKVTEYFQREQTISVILKAEEEQAGEQFISIDSLLNIVF